ncbi:MAG: FISUMP domain-containing protein [Bacteroidota bacterium]
MHKTFYYLTFTGKHKPYNRYMLLNNKPLLLLTLLGLTSPWAHCQTTFTDPRDEEQYPVIQIGDHVWFQENLRVLTPTSWCAEHPDSEACDYGNYYYASDLISACPTGWRVPSWPDYRAAIAVVEQHYGVELISQKGRIKSYTLNKALQLEAETLEGFTILNDSTFFNMTNTGWIQGDKWKPSKAANQWIIHEFSNNPKPHVHIKPEHTLMHSHDYNILDKPRKVRRFSVRCIRDAE